MIQELLKSYKSLTREEELAAFERGDKQALALSQIAMVVREARRMEKRSGVDVEVLVSAGLASLAGAINQYDGVHRLTTFTSRPIFWAIAAAASNEGTGIGPGYHSTYYRKIYFSVSDDIERLDSGWSDDVDREEEFEYMRARVVGLLHVLDDMEREVLSSAMRGESPKDIAKRVDVTAAWVRTKLVSAKRKIRNRLIEDGEL
jgi:RNA polymerase sigma factor (sigma-70 family)